jgi:Uma2 family endonuclease
MVTLQLKQLSIPPGQRILLHNISWPEFEAILTELGDHRATRLAYSNGTLEIRMPLPEHERVKVIISDLLKALLDELDMNWESYGSSTFKRREMNYGIEPDDCFYIQNHARMIGRTRIDLAIDLPPDLALEVDVTSRTQVSAYEALGVPEIWRYENGTLQINVLQDGIYVESPTSPIFPDFPVVEGFSEFIEMSRTTGTSPTLRAFRKWVRSQV